MQQQTVCEKSLMGKVREPILLLVDFIAEQSAKSEAGIGAVSTFHVHCVDLYRAALNFSVADLLCYSGCGFPDH